MSNKLTTQEKGYLTTLATWEVGQGGSVSVTKQFFGEIVDRKFQTSNVNQLQKLVDRGYLEKIIGGNKIAFYSLTDKGRSKANKWLENAAKYQWKIAQPSLFYSEGFEDAI